uniref:Cation-dependent mannose-6-phosphate receptor n=1 Tax=Sphaeramia orbicularis TaxID=375764 RepID=A0A673AJ75_9TELE
MMFKDIMYQITNKYLFCLFDTSLSTLNFFLFFFFFFTVICSVAISFTVETKNGSESYKYIFRLCEDAGGVPEAGVIQIEKQTTTVIGRYDATEAIGGSDWVMLIYRNGEKYDKHCSQESRRAIVMITCDRNKDLTVVREDRDKNQECFYLFEMDSSAVCPVLESKLSAGSIILIIGFCLVAQFPNYAFWVEVGNMSAVSQSCGRMYMYVLANNLLRGSNEWPFLSKKKKIVKKKCIDLC